MSLDDYKAEKQKNTRHWKTQWIHRGRYKRDYTQTRKIHLEKRTINIL
jgi:hypothetical protein